MLTSNQFSYKESSNNGTFNLPPPHPFHYRHHSSPMIYSYSAPTPKTSYNSQRNLLESPVLQMDSISSMRYEICLEAPTAAAQRIDESPMTYLNKGQYYNINLKDQRGYGGDIISTAIITFHDESHRAGATDYWKFWLTHQEEGDNAKAVELDMSRSNGIEIVDNRDFDRITFRWNGNLGASIFIRFNCLSTDFSRIKGVKGIPLRLQMESQASTHIEKTYCKIKLFRDKGAERKNKDDAKHIERQLEKLREKNGDVHPFWLAYSPTSPITLFKELSEQVASVPENKGFLMTHTESLPSPASSNTMKRSFSSSSSGNNFQPTASFDFSSSLYSSSGFPTLLDHDPLPRKRRISRLCLLVKFESNEIYRAIYLEELTVKDLTEKILQHSEIKKPISQVIRKFKQAEKKDIVVRVDDEVVEEMIDDQDLVVQTEENEDQASLTLVLIF